ncbi:hypothetical protein ABH926_002177 [Catenulispora sp. GP43]|uniref:hypothetical protein n=1 Tax=Catenulispora sp. GP43 TaxID=3156263 RepID=UPI003519B71E
MTDRYAVAARLEPPPEAPPLSPAILADLLWAHARPGDQLDHVRTAPDPTGGITLVLLVRADSQPEAVGTATGLCVRALCTHTLTDYGLHDMAALPLSDVTRAR